MVKKRALAAKAEADEAEKVAAAAKAAKQAEIQAEEEKQETLRLTAELANADAAERQRTEAAALRVQSSWRRRQSVTAYARFVAQRARARQEAE